MKKIIIGLVGDLASGKTTIANYLCEEHKGHSHRFSTMLRDILNRVYVDLSRDNLQTLSTFLREQYGQDIMSKTIAKDIAADESPIVIADGVRRPTDITYLREMEGFHLIYVTADPQLRYTRITERNENADDTGKTFEQFLKDEQAEADRLIKELGQEADYTIINDGSMEELYTQVDDLLNKLGT